MTYIFILFSLAYSFALHQAFSVYCFVKHKENTFATEVGLFAISAILLFILYYYLHYSNFSLKKWFRSNYFVSTILIISFILRMSSILFFETYPTMDAYQYFMDGVKIAENNYFADAANTPYWPVGYKIFIGILFYFFPKKIIVVQLSQAILHLIAEYLMYKIAFKISKNYFVSKITLLLLAIYPNHILYTGLIWSETLFFTIVLLGFYLLLVCRVCRDKTSLLFFNGLIWGAAALVRPVAMFYPFAFFAAFFLLRRVTVKICVKQLLIIYLAFFVILSPWVYRNYKLYDKFILISTNGSLVLFMTFVVDNDGNKFDEMVKPRGNIDQKDLSKYALNYMMENPYRTLKIIFRSFKKLYKSDFDGVESIIQSRIPSNIMTGDMLNKVIAAVNPEINLINLKDVFEKRSDAYYLKQNLSEASKIKIAQTILYSFTYPYWYSEDLTLIFVRFINSIFYYFVLFTNILLIITTSPKRLISFFKKRPLYLIGPFFILINTGIYVLSQGDSRYHYPLMSWFFFATAFFIWKKLVLECIWSWSWR
ncbi:MAG: hypothetical protein HQK49_15005 [Oligoflexia bacterium]|nr:hypothetical protein [Oligoflexia bacterium]